MIISLLRDKCDIHGRGECKCNKVNAIAITALGYHVWINISGSIPSHVHKLG